PSADRPVRPGCGARGCTGRPRGPPRPPGTPSPRPDGTNLSPTPPPPAPPRAAPFFSQRLLQDPLVQRVTGHELLQLPRLVLGLLELAPLRHAQAPVLLPPPISGALRHLQLPAELEHQRSRLRLAQPHGDLLLAESTLPDGRLSSTA